MEGFEDPFNRQTYPWGHEDTDLLEWYRALGWLRGQHPALRRGSIRYVCGKGPLLAFLRESREERLALLGMLLSCAGQALMAVCCCGMAAAECRRQLELRTALIRRGAEIKEDNPC